MQRIGADTGGNRGAMTRWLMGLVVLVASGCASNLSALQTARTLEQGHVRVSAGAGLYVPAGQVTGAIGQGVDATARALDALANDKQIAWTDDDNQALATSAVAIAVMPPAPLMELQVRAGVVSNLEAGLRLSTNAIRLDGKYRVFHDGDEIDPKKPFAYERSTDVAILAGVSKHFFSGPLFSLLEFVKLDDFSRWDLEGSVLVSHESSKWFGFYGGPRYVYSHTSFDENLEKLSQGASELVREPAVVLPGSVDMHFIGATAGIRVGHPQVSLMLELTGGYTIAWAKVLDRNRDLGGVTFYPSAGLYVAF